MNAFAERFIGSVRREAFDWFILFNQGQIRNILVEYVGYYNEKRPHQGIAQKVPKGYTPQKQGKVITYPILSGLHHHYKALSLSFSFDKDPSYFLLRSSGELSSLNTLIAKESENIRIYRRIIA